MNVVALLLQTENKRLLSENSVEFHNARTAHNNILPICLGTELLLFCFLLVAGTLYSIFTLKQLISIIIMVNRKQSAENLEPTTEYRISMNNNKFDHI